VRVLWEVLIVWTAVSAAACLFFARFMATGALDHESDEIWDLTPSRPSLQLARVHPIAAERSARFGSYPAVR
jgi:hypothetical protein